MTYTDRTTLNEMDLSMLKHIPWYVLLAAKSHYTVNAIFSHRRNYSNMYHAFATNESCYAFVWASASFIASSSAASSSESMSSSATTVTLTAVSTFSSS